MIVEMKKALQRGEIDEYFFEPSSVEYLAAMGRNYYFVDHLFLKFFAVLTNRDIVILPLHPGSALINQEFTWIFGKIYSSLFLSLNCQVLHFIRRWPWH